MARGGRGSLARLPGGAVRRRADAVPALHLGHDREAEGHRAHERRLPDRRRWRRTTWCSTSSPRRDVYWCSADIGWVTGHSYIVYGPLANGCTSILYEGAPDYPDKDRWWDIVERYKCTIFYTAPTAIRACIKWGREYPDRHDLSSLRLLGSVGEPINPRAWLWYHEVIGGGRCPIVDTWWQTETGHIMITPLPGITRTEARARRRCRSPAIKAAIYDSKGNEVEVGGGILVLTRPWPGMFRTLYKEPERYVETYWSQVRARRSTWWATPPAATRTATSGSSAAPTT